MNAPANIQYASAEVFEQSAAERAHASAIRVFCPRADDMELAVRCDLAAIRDAASIGARRAKADSSAVILGEVVRMATNGVYAALPVSRLIRLRATLNFTMEAARAVERTQRDG